MKQLFERFVSAVKARSLSGQLKYSLGRFYAIRKARRVFRSKADAYDQNYPDRFISISNPNIATQLRTSSFATGIALRPEVLEELKRLIGLASVSPSGRGFPAFKTLDDVETYNKSNIDKPVVMVNFKSDELSQLTNIIATDPGILKMVRQQLNGGIKNIEKRVQASLVVDAPDSYREQQGQTVTFHYDIHDLDFVYVFFYLTEVDRNSGAHELIQDSHIYKPLRFLLGSARRSERELLNVYDKNKFKIIAGPEGTGFIEDTSCFHRARAPITSSRIALQLRYS